MKSALADAAQAAETHIQLAKSLQTRGALILSAIPFRDNKIDLEAVDAGDLAKLIANSTTAIREGVRIENEARDRLLRLQKAL